MSATILELTLDNAEEIAQKVRDLLSGKRLRIESRIETVDNGRLLSNPDYSEVSVYRVSHRDVTIWISSNLGHQGASGNSNSPATFSFDGNRLEINHIAPSGRPLRHVYTVLGDL
jgi:hypothetical protein